MTPMTPMILVRKRPEDSPGDARIEATPAEPGRVTVRVSGRTVANTTSPDTIDGWRKTVAALVSVGWGAP